MTTTMDAKRVFHTGDEVTLIEGIYTCTLGVFLRLKEDPKWAEITERDGVVRSHPVQWLAHIADAPWGRKA